MKQTSWKTTLASIGVAAIPIIDALIDAYNSGAFNGKSGKELLAGIGIVIFGMVSKDHDKTGTGKTDKDNGTTTN